MTAYLVRRLLLTVSTVFGVSFGAFVGFGLSLDPTYPMVLGPPGPRKEVQAYYHLTDPILSRYWRWLTGFFHHGFGTTVNPSASGGIVAPGEPIGPQIWHAAGITTQLVGFALVLVVIGSVVVGTIASRRQRFRADISARFVAYLAASVPTFLIGDLLRRAIVPQQAFASFGGTVKITNAGGAWFLVGSPTGGFADWFRHMTLPALALAIGLIGIYSRYIRSAMLVAIGEPYVQVARAKGLPESRVIVRHALRNSLIPFTSLLSLDLGGVVGASIAADAVFNTGGLASTFLSALGQADPFELTALVVTSAVLVCLFAFAGDVLVGMLDPRIGAART